MKIYLAGGYSGNLKPIWDKLLIKPFKESRKYCIDKSMFKDLNILENYYYLRKAEKFMNIAQDLGGFLLDSGAFTFMQGNHKGKINWEEYVEEYGAFINKYNIRHFFELDIDRITSWEHVKQLRQKLETITNKQVIPVWHKERGKEEFLKMCEMYSYVALGTMRDYNKYQNIIPWFIQEAHKRGAKIHGLGFTRVEKLKQFHFDSVDSTAWLYGNRSGTIYIFNPLKGNFTKVKKDGCRLNSLMAAENNYKEWVKFSNYAKLYL